MKRIQSLEMSGITKTFGDFTANEDVTFEVKSGECMGLLGENGAGKTTLMNVLYGLYAPDHGEVKINGKAVVIRNPRDSIRLGIGMVHQHFMLVQNHTVLENLALGFEDAPFYRPDRAIRARLAEFSEQYGIEVDPDKKVWELSAGEQQRVEIVKALMKGADMLILDEPTSVLTPQEAKDLFRIVRTMKAQGHSAILISHKLDEIMDICDHVTVLRKGQLSGTAAIGDVDHRELARMMVGRDVVFDFKKKPLAPGEEVLRVENLWSIGDRGVPAVKDVSLTVRENEIVGIAGVSGNGQRELVEAVTGLRKAEEGKVFLRGKEITNESARVISSEGVSHVPEERIKFGVVPNLLIAENSVLKHHHNKPFARVLFLNYRRIKDHAKNIVSDFQVAARSIKTPMKNLSGGNIQKLILGREIAAEPALLVASHPTYGLDVGATQYIRERLLERRDQGGSVLLVSEDLEEIFEVCDRIAVMFDGKLMGIVPAESATVEEIGLMMAGSREEK